MKCLFAVVLVVAVMGAAFADESDEAERAALLEENAQIMKDIERLEKTTASSSSVSKPVLRRLLLEDAAEREAGPTQVTKLPLCDDDERDNKKFDDYCRLAEEIAQSPDSIAGCFFCSVSHRFLGTAEAYEESLAMFRGIKTAASSTGDNRRKGKREGAILGVMAPYYATLLDFTSSGTIPERALPFWYMMRSRCLLADRSACAAFVEPIPSLAQLDADTSDDVRLSEYLTHLGSSHDPRFWGFMGKSWQQGAASPGVKQCMGIKARGMWGGGYSAALYPYRIPRDTPGITRAQLKSLAYGCRRNPNTYKPSDEIPECKKMSAAFKKRHAGPVSASRFDCTQRTMAPFSVAVYKSVLNDIYPSGGTASTNHNCASDGRGRIKRDGSRYPDVTCDLWLNRFMLDTVDIVATCDSASPDPKVWNHAIDKYTVDGSGSGLKQQIGNICASRDSNGERRISEALNWIMDEYTPQLDTAKFGRKRGTGEMLKAFKPLQVFVSQVLNPSECLPTTLTEGVKEYEVCHDKCYAEGAACETQSDRSKGKCRKCKKECVHLKKKVARCRPLARSVPTEDEIQSVLDEIAQKYPQSKKEASPEPEKEEESYDDYEDYGYDEEYGDDYGYDEEYGDDYGYDEEEYGDGASASRRRLAFKQQQRRRLAQRDGAFS